MKSILFLRFLICTLLLFASSYVFSSSPLLTEPTLPATQQRPGVRAANVIKLTAADYVRMTGKKMTLRQKMGLVILKTKLKREVRKHPNLLLSDFSKDKKMATGWLVLLIVLSALLLLFLIFAIAYSGGF